jgi:riboflavin synthase
MFTGLIADIGRIQSIRQSGSNWELTVETSFDIDDIELGESIAIDGACLTVTRTSSGAFSVDASPETLRRTNLGERDEGDAVHLERALRVGDRLGGHMVLGHVDAVGELVSRKREKNAWLLDFHAPNAVAQYLIEKGSVAIDGVSLTVNTIDGMRFGVAIIPHTSEKTNLVDYDVGRRVNLEADVLGKYVKRFISPQEGGITREMLQEYGFDS